MSLTLFKLEGINREVKILNPGCTKCKQTERVVKNAVAESAVTADVKKITDMMEPPSYGVFGTPTVVVDGEVKSTGKIPNTQDVKSWLSM